MIQSLVHRGPDDGGVWVDPNNGIALGHRRLAILDLSPSGKQPMFSADGRFIITFNGEIYNYRFIQKELSEEGNCPPLRGTSDTEVMLAAINAWGLKKALKKFVGMFAFALWDKAQQVLYLVRDRVGVKPLYYGSIGGSFVFASELRAFKCFPEFPATIDRRSVAIYLRFGYIPAPYSIYENLFKLSPAHVLTITRDQLDQSETHPLSSEPYWSATDLYSHGSRNPLDCSESEATDELEKLLRHSVGLELISDVPLGAFLSGGVDSSIIVSLMQTMTSRPVKTFSIGFAEQQYNEAHYARQIAQYLGTDHHELYVTDQMARDTIPDMRIVYDEPFADPSQIPTVLVSRLARQHVTVSLSGDGGDEVFVGYGRHYLAGLLDKYLFNGPSVVKQLLAMVLKKAPLGMLDVAGHIFRYLFFRDR